ncbi:uncharacterized protein LOC122268052 [Penaeus japonicus]|uniref:uncharacterized protein LOC122268052 n=1 Tax=Penaeus japonicus TaxID=27405 RepID=UPI001C70CADE|nr:uncharacterized protein LOC122268052 [Penaeus japonicus]
MTSEFILSKPFWNVANTLVLPVLSDDNGDGIPKLRSLVSLSLPITIFLDSILGEPPSPASSPGPSGRSGGSRSLGEDQLNIFRSIEDSLASLGVDGRSCLLRLICELQGNAFGRYTVVGELLTLLFTPKRGMNDFLHDYIEAEDAGREGSDCTSRYHTCPFSFTGTLEKYRRYMQSVSSIEDKPEGAEDHKPFANSIGNDHFALPKVVVN